MGYDIHMVETPTNIDSKLQLQNPDSPGYHRYNIRAMPITMGAMEWAECIEYEPAPAFPSFPFSDEERGEQVMYFLHEENHLEEGETMDGFEFTAPTDAERSMAVTYQENVEAHLCAPNENGGVPPSYKFESNSGWLVTPDECLVVANAIDEHKEMIAQQYLTDAGMTADDGRIWLTNWADYNRLASANGGYRIF